MENDNPERRKLIDGALGKLAIPANWEPNATAARNRFNARVGNGGTRRHYWPTGVAVTIVLFAVMTLNPGARARAQQWWQWLTVGKVEVVRVDFSSLPDQARSLHPTLLHQPVQPQPAVDIGQAAKMAGFVPRLPPSSILPGAPRLSVMSPMSFGMTINTSDLELALRMGGVVDQPVPREWDGARLVMQFGPTIVAEWPDISIMQTEPPALSAPPSFDLGEFTVALLRAAGMPREQAQRIGRRMNIAPVLLCGISEDEHVTISDVPLRNGTNGTMIENYGENGRLERAELLWSTGDRVFVFSGATSVELAKAVANWTQ